MSTSRPDFAEVATQLDRLDVLADAAQELNKDEWGHLKSNEDYGRVFVIGGELQHHAQWIYGTGRDCAVWMSDLGRYSYAA